MDCSIVPLPFHQLTLVSTTDFFYPLVDDPYMQGKIACANVLSDLYSMGIDRCDTMLMILGASTSMEKKLRFFCTAQVMKGFNDLAEEAGTKVTGGQSVLNPWPIIGGTATCVARQDDFIEPTGAKAGQVLVLTKPLGTQVAVNAHEWLRNGELAVRAPAFVRKFAGGLSADQPVDESHVNDEARAAVAEIMAKAVESMARLNRVAARAMRDNGATAATDVTGFGILGHANNLAESQIERVHMQLDTLVLIKHAQLLAADAPYFNLFEGFSAETSGGLLACVPADKAEAFVKQCEPSGAAWIVGKVIECPADEEPKAFLAEDLKIIEH